jgi:cyclopropane-fatty-acyl-phospholipid synthase
MLFSLLRSLQRGSIVLTLPDGSRHSFAGAGPGPQAEMTIHNLRVVRRSIFGGNIGFAESYMDGDWETSDLAVLLQLLVINDNTQRAAYGRRLMMLAHRLWHRVRPNTKRGSRRNIAAHYDLGNEFYRRWLDPSMTYSSAVFPQADDSLEQAQANKYRLLCDRLDIKPDQRVLEIGCGWGGFATFAAREYKAKVTAITISKEQFDYAGARIQKAGLAERVDVRLTDYRDVADRFDRIASIEMFEAVGEKYWPQFFGKLRDSLAPGGRAALQVITIADQLFDRYKRGVDFIQRYIFPGGMLPSPMVFMREAMQAGLQLERQEFFGTHYARTLADWQQRFQAAWAEIAPLGYDLRFKRMWEFYLAYCEAGFRAGTIDVTQTALVKA